MSNYLSGELDLPPLAEERSPDVVGSYVVFDPTGRDLLDCMEVGRVLRVFWDTQDDDGDAQGRPRPLLLVQTNDGEVFAVTCVETVLRGGAR